MSDTVLEELTPAEKQMLDKWRAKCKQNADIRHDYLHLLTKAAEFADWEYTAGAGKPFTSGYTMFTDDFPRDFGPLDFRGIRRQDTYDFINALMHLAMACAKPIHLRSAEENDMVMRIKAYGGQK